MRPKYDVFLSYGRTDLEDAKQLACILKNASLNVWFEQWETLHDDDWFRATSEAQDSSSALLVLIGAHGMPPNKLLHRIRTQQSMPPTDGIQATSGS